MPAGISSPCLHRGNFICRQKKSPTGNRQAELIKGSREGAAISAYLHGISGGRKKDQIIICNQILARQFDGRNQKSHSRSPAVQGQDEYLVKKHFPAKSISKF